MVESVLGMLAAGVAGVKRPKRVESRVIVHITWLPSKEQTVSTQPVPTARDVVRGVAPKLIDLSEKVLFGDVWERPGLSKRDRRFSTGAALIAMYRTDQLPGHLERALNNGVTREEIGEIITHLAFYAGCPPPMPPGPLARRIFDARKPCRSGSSVSARRCATWRPL